MPFTNPSTRSLGGKARQAQLTPAQRKQLSLNALKVRWDKVKAMKKKAA